MSGSKTKLWEVGKIFRLKQQVAVSVFQYLRRGWFSEELSIILRVALANLYWEQGSWVEGAAHSGAVSLP